MSIAASWDFQVAILIVAYRTDGAVAVAGVGIARMVPATIVAPFAALIGSRVRGDRALVAIHLVRAVAVGLGALTLVLGWPRVISLCGVAVEAGAAVLVRPIQTALLPALATSPGELVAANVASSTGEGIGGLTGPIIGGTLTAIAGAPVACGVAVCALLAAALASAFTRVTDSAVPLSSGRTPPIQQLAAGVLTLRDRRNQSLLVACFGAQTVVRGLMNVLLVVAAIELLGLGDAGVGTLNFAVGLGGLLGAVGSLGFVGRPRLSLWFAFALACWGLPLSIIGAVPLTPVAVGMLIMLGADNAILDITGFTLLQRTLSNTERMAVLALLEGVVGVGVAVGSLAGPALLAQLGLRGALVFSGLILPIVAAVTWASVREADARAVVPAHEMALLRSLPMFAPLPLTVIEQLAGSLTRVEFQPGAEIMRQGDAGDCFYVIDRGEVEIERDGRAVPLVGPLAAVGEIALLRKVPRTATVRAATATTAYALRGQDFVAAVTGSQTSAAAADHVVGERLAAFPDD